MLMRVALALTLIMACVTVYSWVKYYGVNDVLKTQRELKSTYDYFDFNRGLKGIQAIEWKGKTSGAPTTPVVCDTNNGF
jgi:hypothetical protein